MRAGVSDGSSDYTQRQTWVLKGPGEKPGRERAEKENARLKRAVAELTLDRLTLKEASEGNF